MHHRMPPSKTVWPILNVVIFPPVLCLVLDDTVTNREIIDQIHEIILEDIRMSSKSIAEQLEILREKVWSITRRDLDMRKLSDKRVPKCLNADQKRQRCQSSEQIWKFFGAIQMIFCRDRCSWTKPGYNTMTRRQSNNQWSGGIAAYPTQKKSESRKPLEKFSPRFFWDQRGFLLTGFLPKSQTIKAEYYSSLLV